MNPFLAALSATYIFGIFYWADSPALSQISEFNPFSLLHITLYGILTVLLLLAFAPETREKPRPRYIFVALGAIVVGILDEYYQSFIPTRDASLGDVFLDVVGVSLVMILAYRFPPSLWASFLKGQGLGWRIRQRIKDIKSVKEET